MVSTQSQLQNVNEESDIPSVRTFQTKSFRSLSEFYGDSLCHYAFDKLLWKPNSFRQTRKTDIN